MSEQLFGIDSLLFASVQQAFNQNKRDYACVEVIFNKQTKLTSSDTPASILGLFRISEGLDWRKGSAFKKEKKEAVGTEGNATAFSMLSA